jgi:hypothetical protein
MKNTVKVLVGGVLVIFLAFGMVACGDTDPDPDNMNGEINVSTDAVYVDDTFTVTYSGTEKGVQYMLSGQTTYTDVADTKKGFTVSPGVVGKLTISMKAGGKDPITRDIVVGPKFLKPTSGDSTTWVAEGTAGPSEVEEENRGKAFTETLLLSNVQIKMDNTLSAKTSSTGKQYFYFTITDWEVATNGDTATKDEYLNGYKVTGTTVEDGYAKVTTCGLYFNEDKSIFVLQRGPGATTGLKYPTRSPWYTKK